MARVELNLIARKDRTTRAYVPGKTARRVPGFAGEGPALPGPTSSQGIFIARQHQHQRWVRYFHYGRLADEHPVAVYVNRLLLKLGDSGWGKKVVICPHWKEINAEAHADGYILISGRLLKFCEYEEELLGMIAHEIQHQRGRHGEKEAEREDNFLKDLARAAGGRRAQEISADVEGSIALLDRYGINPAGYKRFCRRLYAVKEKFRSRDVSVTHGSSLGRYLQASEIFHVYDFTSLSRRLTPLPEEQKKAIAECDRGENKGRILGISVTKAEAEKIIPSLTLKEAFYAFEQSGGTEIRPLLYGHIQQQLKALFPGGTEVEREAFIWAFWAIALHTPPKSVLKKYGARLTPEALLNALDKMVALAPDISLAHDPGRAILGPLKEQGFIQQVSFDDYKKLVNSLYEVLIRLYRKSGLQEIDREEFFESVIIYYYGRNAQRIFRALEEEPLPEEAKTIFNQLGRMKKGFAACAEKLVGIYAGNYEGISRALRHTVACAPDSEKDYAVLINRARVMLGAIKLYQALLLCKAGAAEPTFTIVLETYLFAQSLNQDYLLGGLDLFIDTYEHEKHLAGPGDAWKKRTKELGQLHREIAGLGPKSVLAEKTPAAEDLLFLYHNYYKKNFHPDIFYAGVCRYFCAIEKGGVVAEILRLQEMGLDILNAEGDFGYLVHRIFSAPEKELAALAPRERGPFLLSLCPWIKTAHVRQKLQKLALDRFWDMLPFEEKLGLLFGQEGARVILDNERRERFVENETTTFGEIARVREEFKKSFDEAVTRGSVSVGVAAALECLNLSRPGRAREIVAILMATKTSDKELKHFLLETVESPERSALSVKNFTRVIDQIDKLCQLIFSLGEIGKYLLVRSLLVTSGKILVDKDERVAFVKDLLQNSLAQAETPAEAGARKVIDDVVEVLGRVEEWEPLYFALAGYLRPRIALPPEKPYNLEEDYYLQEKVLEACAEGADLRLEEKKKYKGIADYAQLKDLEAGEARENPHEHDTFYSNQGDALASRWIDRQHKKQPPPVTPDKIDAFSFILEVAGTQGSVGVRFLQLLPLFFALEPAVEEKFSQVYDRVKGASKIVSADVVHREGPELTSELVGIGAPIGGGSMRRVYRSPTRKGERRVLRVLNPNCRYKAEETFDFLEKIIGLLAEKDAKNYQTAKMVLAYVKEWVEQDIVQTEESVALDRGFKRENDAYHQGRFRYSIYVPQTFGRANTYWQLEEEIEGHNLTEWDQLKKDGHAMKQIVALLANNYFAQLYSGVLHSDISIGNVRITADNKVVWLDRNYLLKLPAEENNLLLGLLVGDNRAREKTLLAYLRKKLAPAELSAFKQFSHSLFQSGGDPAQKIQQCLIGLFGMGVKLPLSVVLVLKNLLVLDKLAKKAGFGGLVDTFNYEPR